MIEALSMARPLATQNGPVLPLVVSEPPKSLMIGCKAIKNDRIRRIQYNHHFAEIRKAKLTPRPDEGADFADGSSETIELTADGSRASLSGQETEAVARTDFSKAEKHAINDGKRCHVLCQLDVEAAHDESHDGLTQEAEYLEIKHDR